MYVSLFAPLFRRHATFASYLPWYDLIQDDPPLIGTDDDGLMSTLELSPYDQATMLPALQGTVAQRINQGFKRTEETWAFWLHGKRRPKTDYPDASWPDEVSTLLDEEHGTAMTRRGARFATRVFLTLWHRPPPRSQSLIEQVYFPNGAREEEST